MKPKRKTNAVKIRAAYRKNYYARNRNSIIEKAAEHARQNRPRRRETSLAYYHRLRVVNPAKAMVAKSRSSAKKRGIEFAITEFDVVVPEFCPVLGVVLASHRANPGPNSPSLDRIESSRGYVPGNVWVISHRANQIKSDATPDELIRVAEAVRRKIAGLA